MIEIPTINRTKKTPKPRYNKPDSVKQLEIEYFEHKYRNSTIPVQCRFKRSAFYQRQNSQGQYDSRLKIWRKSGTTKGIADVQVTYKGKTFNLEIKVGKDRQSEVQKEVERKIKAAGGHYAIINCFDDFLRQIIINV